MKERHQREIVVRGERNGALTEGLAGCAGFSPEKMVTSTVECHRGGQELEEEGEVWILLCTGMHIKLFFFFFIQRLILQNYPSLKG